MDVFDRFFETLPAEQKFSLTELPPAQEKAFQLWAKNFGQNTDPVDYDIRGAFAAGMEPDETGHLGSIGNDMKQLKAPSYKTAWKTAFVEIMRDLQKHEEFHPDQFPGRKEAASFVDNLLMGEPGL
jgi:hypothetical protein